MKQSDAIVATARKLYGHGPWTTQDYLRDVPNDQLPFNVQVASNRTASLGQILRRTSHYTGQIEPVGRVRKDGKITTIWRVKP